MRVLVKDSVYKDLSGLEKDRKRQGALLDAAIQGISEQHSGAIKKLKGGLKTTTVLNSATSGSSTTAGETKPSSFASVIARTFTVDSTRLRDWLR